MFGSNFYFKSIRKMVALFGTLFNDISITRDGSSGETLEIIKVPITYSPKDKMLARVSSDRAIDRPYSQISPLMAFEIVDYNYDGSRKLGTINKFAKKDDDDSSVAKYQYAPVPWNMTFALYVVGKNAEDCTKIVEQILPYFTPEFTVSVELVPEMDITHDIPIILSGVTLTDSYADGAIADRRTIVWTLNFTVKTYFYGPVKSKKLIKYANVFVYSSDDANNAVSVASTRVAMLANGSPTTNAAASVSLNAIWIDSDYGFSETYDDLITE